MTELEWYFAEDCITNEKVYPTADVDDILAEKDKEILKLRYEIARTKAEKFFVMKEREYDNTNCATAFPYFSETYDKLLRIHTRYKDRAEKIRKQLEVMKYETLRMRKVQENGYTHKVV